MVFIAATNNKHKLEEMKRILSFAGHSCISPDEAGISACPDENANSFSGNARIKARAFFDIAEGCAVIADDSGLEVDALSGEPGVLSARFGGAGLSDEGRWKLLLKKMKENSCRNARFVCAVVCILPDGREIAAKGVCEGEIGSEPAGCGGFGYDPVFFVNGKSLAEMSESEKDAISHRGKALKELVKKLLSESD